MRILTHILALLGLWVAATARLASAYERFDFDQRYLVQPGYIVKDHSTIKGPGDTLHVFYIKADEALPEAQRAKALGHATTLDLRHWTFHPDVIPVVPGTWEGAFVWAPHVVEWNGSYCMFYTGVNSSYAQAIGLASSPDLYTWSKVVGNPIYMPSTTWATWSTSSWSNCRDPFVFRDGSTWYLLTTAWTNTSRGAISLATSTDLVTWSDQGPLFVHPGPQAWHVLESCNINYQGGKYHMTFTEEGVAGTFHMSASSLFGPWDYATRTQIDAGHAAEIFRIDSQWRISRHTAFQYMGGTRYVLKYDDIAWFFGRPASLPANPLSGWTVVSGNAFDMQPTFLDNSLARGSTPSNFGGNSWIGTYERFPGPLQGGWSGAIQGESPTGILKSRSVTLTGNRISFRIGGGDDAERLFLALYDAGTNEMLLRATGHGSDTMRDVEWYVAPWTGRAVYLQIGDLSADAWGHVNVDEIREWNSETTDATPPLARLVLHPNAPNPFNPTTRLSFELPAAGRARLAVHDARGRLVRALVDARLGPGLHRSEWDGRQDDGRSVASGAYFLRLRLDDGAALQRSIVLVR